MTSRRGGRAPVGRQRELAELERLLASAREGDPQLVFVEGPAGIGKTALVEHLLDRHELTAQRATGMLWEQTVRFGVVDQLLQTGPSAAVPPDGTPVRAAERLLDRWAEAPPDAVVVDDAHHADIASLQALLSAYRRMTDHRLLLVLVARDDLMPRELRRGRVLRIGPLGSGEVRTLAMLHAGRDLPAPTVQRLTGHTGGNPEYVRELLDELPARAWLDWQPVLPAPRGLAAETARRLDSCGYAARRFVESAAVLGSTSPVAEAAELAGIDDPVQALDEAAGHGLVSTVSGHALLQLAFASPLVHAAVYASLPPLQRSDLHRRAAERSEDEDARLTHLVAVTPNPDADLAAELDAFAVRQSAAGAWSVAGGALLNASRLSPTRHDRQQRLLRAVDAMVGAGELLSAGAFAPQLESMPPGPLRDAVLGYLAIQRGRAAEAELLLTRAWQQCDLDREPETAALICQRRVLHSLSRWHGPELVAWGRRAMSLADPDEPSAVESEAIMGLGLAATGESREAERTYRQVVGRVSRGAQSQRVHMGKGWLDLAMDRPQTARRELESAMPGEHRMGSTRISLWAHGWLARTLFALGDWDEALQTVDRAAVLLQDSGLDLCRPLVHWTGAQIHALRGDFDSAEAHLAHTTSAAGHNYETMLAPSCMAKAHFAEARSDYAGVLRALDPLVQLHPRNGIDEPGFWPWHDIHANALVMANRAQEADEFLVPFEQLAEQRGHRSSQARLGYARGRVLAAAGDIDAAKDVFERSVHLLAGLPLPYERARVHFAYGQTLRRAGKRKEADVVMQRAREAYAALGAETYVVRCDRELKAGGVYARRDAADLTDLTPQEHAVVRLVAGGMTNKQAAQELFVSVKTVQFHLTRIYAKLGLRSRSELAARFHDRS